MRQRLSYGLLVSGVSLILFSNYLSITQANWFSPLATWLIRTFGWQAICGSRSYFECGGVITLIQTLSMGIAISGAIFFVAGLFVRVRIIRKKNKERLQKTEIVKKTKSV